VAARARNLGLIAYARRWSHLDDQRLIGLRAHGSRIEDVAQRLGRTPKAIRRHASRRGIAPPSLRPQLATLGGGLPEVTSCCACTTRSTPLVSPRSR
jgi:hypothetical protein